VLRYTVTLQVFTHPKATVTLVARTDTTQQSRQTPDNKVEIKNITVYVSGYTETDTTGMLSPPTVWPFTVAVDINSNVFFLFILPYLESVQTVVLCRFWLQYSGGLKTDSHIACRAHAVSLPCRAAKGLECVFPITVRPCLIHKNVKCESDTAALCKSNGKDTF
jgi:hypothetical protein